MYKKVDINISALNSETTQRKNTIKSYINAANIIKKNFSEAKSILDYGAGFGIGTKQLEQITGIPTDSFEPHPQKYSPTFNKASDINKQYDIVVCLNVLNVLQPHIRKIAVKTIYKVLNNNGKAFIGTRKFSGDIDRTVKFEPDLDDPKALYTFVKRKGQVLKVYQKGFDGRELEAYIKSIIPSADIKTVKGFGATCTLMTKN